MGFPKGMKRTDNPKDIVLKVRFDKETNRKLETLAEAKGQTKADIIRAGIERQYVEMEKE